MCLKVREELIRGLNEREVREWMAMVGEGGSCKND